MPRIRFAALAAAFAAFALPALAQPIVVTLDGAKVVRMPTDAASVVIGNPAIAGVSMDSSRMAFLTGRSYGATNLMAFDSSGHQIMSVPVTVGAGEAQWVSVFKGSEPLTYACGYSCERVLNPGDQHLKFKELNEQVNNRMDRAKDAQTGSD